MVGMKTFSICHQSDLDKTYPFIKRLAFSVFLSVPVYNRGTADNYRSLRQPCWTANANTNANANDSLFLQWQITKKQSCWSGALRLGFTSKDPSRINPDSLPKYACPDLVSQSGFWAKALPEEFANEGSVIAFWVDKKGRVFYRINESSPMLFFSGVRTTEPLWALIDVYGLTRGVQLLGELAGRAGG